MKLAEAKKKVPVLGVSVVTFPTLWHLRAMRKARAAEQWKLQKE